MLPDDRGYLLDILECARRTEDFVRGVGREEFTGDAMRRAAVIRQLEVIGEAAKQVSPGFRAHHPEIPWRKMTGMRDMLIHAYRSVDEEIVWNAATVSVPALIAALEPLLPSIEPPQEESNS